MANETVVFLEDVANMVSFRRMSWLVVVGLLVAVPAWAAESAQYFPPDTQAVITVNFKQILNSPLLKSDLPKLQAALKGAGEAQDILKALDFDPLKDLDTFAMAAVGAADEHEAVAVLKGKFNIAKFEAHAKDVAKNMANQLKILKVDGQTIYEANLPNTPEPVYIGLIDDTTIVASPKKELVGGAFGVKSGKTKGTLKKELTALLDKSAAAKPSLSFVILGSALPSTGQVDASKINYIDGGLMLTDALALNVDIQTKDADTAKDLKSQIEQGLEQAKGILPFIAMQMDFKAVGPATEIIDVLKVSAKDKSVTIKGEVTKEAIEKLNKKK